MSRINTLVAELCPDGVEYKEIGDVLNYEQPTKYLVASKDYSDEFTTPVLTAGKTFILGYTSEEDGIYPASAENPVIIFDDFTTDFKWVDFPFKAKSSGMKMLTAADENLATIRYAYYAMQMISFSPLDHKRHWISEYSHFEIPVPPIEVQREIVRILDTFAELTDTLTEELDCRRQQYAHYRDRLLSLESLEALDGKPVEMKRLGDVANIKRGKRVVKKHLSASEGYPVFQNCLAPLGYHTDFNEPAGTPFVICAGAAGEIGYSESEYWAADDCYSVECNEGIGGRYAFHALLRSQGALKAQVRKASIPRFSKDVVTRLEIPVPSLETQRKVVDILDRFDDLTTSLTDGLPAEIEARHQQYEYYRDRLLDFPRKTTETE
ncbi:restriction endonuclease subunit S [Collinsella sp. LCP19S3_B7]|uniref:restriction endonuclease subunit S n=1 Tax=Collinsella sp. LCP19S3_B7 TaxID=3438756 RepID=UPI003F91B40D